MDTDLYLAFLLGLSGKRCKQVKRFAIRLQQAQRIPTSAHDEVGTGVDHGPQIARSGIAAVAQHESPGSVGQALKGLGPMQSVNSS